MSAASVTVEVGYTTQRPVRPDQHYSYVTIPLCITDTGSDTAVKHAEQYAVMEAHGMVAARRPVVMVTSTRIVQETL